MIFVICWIFRCNLSNCVAIPANEYEWNYTLLNNINTITIKDDWINELPSITYTLDTEYSENSNINLTPTVTSSNLTYTISNRLDNNTNVEGSTSLTDDLDLVFDTNGIISGTIKNETAPGPYKYTVTVSNNLGSATYTLEFNIVDNAVINGYYYFRDSMNSQYNLEKGMEF